MSKARVNILGALALVTGIPFAAQAFDESDASQPATVAGQVYHVAITGSDANPGTLSQPFRTLAKAAAVVAAGDVVNVHGGVYALTSTLVINKHGSASARIVFQPYLNQAVTIDCAGTPANTSCVALNGSFIDFQGFEIRNAQRQGINTWGGGRYLRIRNNRIHHAQRSGILVGYPNLTEAHVLVEGNVVYLNCQSNNPPVPGGGWPPGVSVYRAAHVTVTHNLIYENFGEGIAFTMSDQGLALQNTLRDNISANIYLDNATRVTVERNFIYGGYSLSSPASGIGMANEGIYGTSNPLNHNRIINNIVVSAKRGISYGSYELGGGLKNTLIAYNTIYSATQATIKIDADAGHTNTLIINNIFYQTGGRPIIMHTASPGITFRHNLWYGGSAGPGAGPGDVNVNPLLANPGGLSAVDYRLLPGSPAINAADVSYPIGLDYFGLSRPVGSSYDIGAHEFRWLAYVPTAQQP